MKKILGLFFSGTGNTKYAIHKLCGHFISEGKICRIYDICDRAGFDLTDFDDYDTVIVAFPTYGSLVPDILIDFLSHNEMLIHNKNLITLVTQFCYSGDGGAMIYKMLKHLSVNHLGSIHVNLPSNLSDFRILKVKNGVENESKVIKANKKIEDCAMKILNNRPVNDGRRLFSKFLGDLQRAVYIPMKRYLFKEIIIGDKCTKCSICVNCCPVNNIDIRNGIIKTNGKCVSCYRCINSCPSKAIRLFGRKFPKNQYHGINCREQ